MLKPGHEKYLALFGVGCIALAIILGIIAVLNPPSTWKPRNATKFDEEAYLKTDHSTPSAAPSLPTMTVCDAITQPVGKRIRVRGEFDGFTQEMTFLILSTGVCNSKGAGMVWVELRANSEREKVYTLHPRNSRKQLPGDPVTVEGKVGNDLSALSEGRSVRLHEATVIFPVAP